MEKNIVVGIISILLVIPLSACSSNNMYDRQIINKPNKQITILGNKSQLTNNEVALEKIDKIKDIRALDWIDENTLLVMKENSEYPKIQHEGGEAHPQNLYEYDINTKKLKLIAGSKVDMGYGILSPDKKYIFYKEGIEENLTGFILNRQTGEKVQVTDIDSISSTEGRWIDNDTVIFSKFPKGGIYIADTKGDVKEIENSPKGMIFNSAKVGDRIFYTIGNGKFYAQDISGKESRLLKSNVIWLIPSQDLENLAMVKRTAETKMSLVIADIEGNEKKTLVEGTQIFGTNWSPDQTKIAYSVASENSGQAGLFVSDIDTGKTVQLTVDIQLAADAVRWSSTGKKLLVSNALIENNEVHFITYVIDLKY